MKRILLTLGLSILFITNGVCQAKSRFTLSNKYLSRTIVIEKGKVHTLNLTNKLAKKTIVPTNNIEFSLRVSDGTQFENTDIVLTSNDFTFKKVIRTSPENLALLVENTEHQMEVWLVYELKKDNQFMNKYLEIKSAKPVTLERIDVEVLALSDIYQPYQMKQITSDGWATWRPGLGQPLYTSQSATFWGTEFPASYNFVENGTAYCGYLWGKQISAAKTYTTYKIKCLS